MREIVVEPTARRQITKGYGFTPSRTIACRQVGCTPFESVGNPDFADKNHNS